jgi:hypothetical protein
MQSGVKQALLDALEEAGSYVLATPEDAAFYRAFLAGKKPAPPPEIAHLPKIVIEKPKPVAEPPPAPKPKPVIQEEKEVVPQVVDFKPLVSVLKKIAPELAIFPEIPSDAIAKKLSERWKTKNQTAPISILCWQEPKEQRELLEQIARAIDVYFGGAKIIDAALIEKEKQWETFLSVAQLKMVIVCDYTLWQLNHLRQFYKETPGRTLGNVPLFLLPDLSLYLKDHLLKRSLWKALCQKFS